MSISIRPARLASTGRVRAIVAGVIGLFAMLALTPNCKAQEYVKVCSLYGAGFFYIPGTDTCVDSTQIVTNQFAIARALSRAATSTAMAAALVNPYLPDNTNFAISTHWATFDGQHAVGFAGMMRLWGNLAFTAGLSVGLDRGKLLTVAERTQTEFGTSVPEQSWNDVIVLGRAGLTYSW